MIVPVDDLPGVTLLEQKKERPRELSALAVLVLAPLFVFSPFLFGGYTLSQNEIGVDRSRPYGGMNLVPLADPAGSALLDEPYLVHLKRELLQARIPILNMQNGLGAPGVESPLTGSFYVLNPVLLLLPTAKPFYYDLFQLLHVYIFLLGTYFLLKYYVSSFAAAATGILVGLSGATYLWFNMENYRNYVWLPFMMAGAVGMAREPQIRKHALLLVFATVACGTAGNPQETAMALGSTVLVYAIEFTASSRRIENAARFAACLLASVLMFSVAVLPYVFSQADGNLWATNDPGRAIRPYDPVWIFSWFLPRVAGFYPFLFLRNRLYWPHGDLSTVGFFLLICGVLYGAAHWDSRWRVAKVSLCLALPVVIAVGLIKIVHVPALDFFQYIPFLRELFFIKYHLYLFALAGIAIAIGLDETAALPDKDRRKVVVAGAMIVLLIVAAAVIYLSFRTEYSIGPDIPLPVRQMVLVKHIGVSLAVFGLGAWILYSLPKRWQGLLLGLFIFQAFAALPFGFAKRLDAYPSWFRAEAAAAKRLLIRDWPNTNLFFNVESIADYDAVINRHYRDFILTFFNVINAQAIYEPTEATFDASQVRALQLVGTEVAVGFRTNAPATLARPNGPSFEIVDPLPRAFVVSSATYLSLYNQRNSKETIEGIVQALQQDVHTIPQPTDLRLGNGSVRFRLRAPSNGVLVLNYAYSTNWTYRGRKAQLFLDLWPAWPIRSSADTDVVLTYWPRGLTVGLWAAFAGLMLMTGLWAFALKAA